MRTYQQSVEAASIDKFVFSVDEAIPDFVVQWFINWFSGYASDGADFESGQKLQFGFTLLRCEVDDRILRLLSPDFTSMPICWTTDLTEAFRYFTAHKYTPESFGFEPDIPSFNDTVIVGRRFDEPEMFMNRLEPDETAPNDSGWFFGISSDDVDNNDPEQLQLMSLYEATLAAPQVVQFLSLPVGCQVDFSTGQPVVLKDYEELPIPEGSYLDQVLNQ